MKRLGWPTLLLVSACFALVACGSKKAAAPATAVATAPATSTAATSSPAASATPNPAAAAIQLAGLNGLRCVGSWKNTTFGSTGAFATRVEAGGSGGTLHFEVGGNVFGAQGGTFDAPFQLVNNQMVISAHSDFLGHMDAKIGLDGKAEGTLQGPPALGLKSMVTMSDYSFAQNKLHFAVKIDFGDGRPPANSVVDAACSKT